MTFPYKGYVQDTIEQPAKYQLYCFVKLHNHSKDFQMSMSWQGLKKLILTLSLPEVDLPLHECSGSINAKMFAGVCVTLIRVKNVQIQLLKKFKYIKSGFFKVKTKQGVLVFGPHLPRDKLDAISLASNLSIRNLGVTFDRSSVL